MISDIEGRNLDTEQYTCLIESLGKIQLILIVLKESADHFSVQDVEHTADQALDILNDSLAFSGVSAVELKKAIAELNSELEITFEDPNSN